MEAKTMTMARPTSMLFAVLFGNRYWYPRIVFLLLATAPLFAYASYQGNDINPPFYQCQRDPQRFHGADLWVPMAVIVSVEPDGLTISAESFRIRVLTDRKGLEPGNQITLRGTFRNDGKGGIIAAGAISRIKHFEVKSRAIFVVSGIMFLIVLWMLSRTFSIKSESLVLREH